MSVTLIVRMMLAQVFQKMTNTNKLFSYALLGFLLLFWRTGKSAAQPGDDKAPILVELFTSEGCSSCPPADTWLRRVDADQPVHGVQLIVLSEHVDYWDHDGWKDPYSSSELTDRQSRYARAFGLDSPYTPQIVVNGKVNLHLNDTQQVRQTFENPVAPKVDIRILSAAIDPKSPAVLHIKVEAVSDPSIRSADIYEAVALDHAESQVLHGENGGKRLEHTAVVEKLVKVGKLEKGKPFSRETEIELTPGTQRTNLRLIVFAQEPGPGKVVGAALDQTIE